MTDLDLLTRLEEAHEKKVAESCNGALERHWSHTDPASVKKTGRVIVAYEDSISWGYGAEIAARIADDCFSWLDAPVKRVASTDTFVGYAPSLEDAILPQVETFRTAYAEIMTY